MSWYDYVPIAGSVARLAQGDWEQAGVDLLGPFARGAYDIKNAYSGAVDQQREGYGRASDAARGLSGKMRDFQMEGLERAQNYYDPAEKRLTAAFGSPGSVRK